MNVFFACKNTLVIMLQLYRLVVVHAESRKAHKLAKSHRYDHEIYTISGSRKRRGGRERHDGVSNIISRPSGGRNPSKSTRKETGGYSTDTSESSTTSVSSVSVAPPPPPVKKSHKNRSGEGKSQKSSTKRREREVVVTSNRHKKKKPEKVVVEEGPSVTDSVSVSEVAVVEVVKEKKNKRKKHQRKASTGSIDSD